MADGAGSFNVIRDYGLAFDDQIPDRVDQDPHWVLAVVRLGTPLSFSRKKMASTTRDLTQGAMLRADLPLVITDDCLSMGVHGTKKSHKKSISCFLKQTTVNYAVEILPGDWCVGWMVNNRPDYLRIIDKLANKQAVNDFNSGLKFVGRVEDVRKTIDCTEDGVITAGYSLSGFGFEELDTMFFYDNSLASKDQLQKDLGVWLTRLGLDVEALFGNVATQGVQQNNINQIIPTLLDLIVGKGPSRKGVINIATPSGNSLSATPSIQNEAPFSYMIPEMIGSILGKKPEDSAKHVISYADILELLMGVQQYSNKNDYHTFIPDLQTSNPNRRLTGTDMLGTYLPFMPEFTNRPLWSVFQQYLNPTINEMYTALRVNPEGFIMPTMVVRQIPFTTEAFTNRSDQLPADEIGPVQGDIQEQIAVTKFLSLPRWDIPSVLIRHLDVGRSNATRTNFVHIYGSSAYQANNAPIQYQLVNNPPIRDDLDIMRSGLRPYMASVECFVSDQVGRTAGSWMRLVADWTIGSHLTLNGSLRCWGIQAPICEGDNTLIDDTVYHIESVSHQASINPGTGKKQWTTSLALTNGMRWGGLLADDENSIDEIHVPIYPGFMQDDNTGFDPGLTMEGRETTGGESHRTRAKGQVTEDGPESVSGGPTQLNPDKQENTGAPAKKSQHKRRKR